MGAKVRQPAGGVERVTPPGEFEYVLKQVSPTMTAHKPRGSDTPFVWPESGPVECPDWDPAPCCGGGLHGWLRGEGDGGLADNSPECKWLILRVKKGEIVNLDGKVKFPRAEVIACGPRHEIVAEMRTLCPDASVIFSTVAKSNQQAAAAGYRGQASAGYRGQASAGNYGQASAGNGGQASAGYRGQASAGDGGQASAGDGGQASAGNYGGQASAGNYGQASAGYGGQASAGNYGQASAGYGGQASAGYGGQASAGQKGLVIVQWWDYGTGRPRVVVGYVGETLDSSGNILEATAKYKLDGQQRFEKVPT